MVRHARADEAGRDSVIYPARTPEQKAFLVKYIADKLGLDPNDLVGSYRFETLGAIKSGKVIGCVLLTQFRSGDAEILCCGEPGWLTKNSLNVIFRYCFEDLQLRRLTSIVHRKHKVARKFNERIGFRMEGVKTSGMADGRDAILYGMTRSACRWI